MRDLYRRLGVQPDASPEELESAIRTCRNADLKRDAEEVLLSPIRRDSYDNLRKALLTIGNLRHRLGLARTPHWHGSVTADFAPADTPAPPRPPRTRTPGTSAHLSRDDKAWLTRFAIIAIFAGTVWICDSLSDSSSEVSESTSPATSTVDTLPQVPVETVVEQPAFSAPEQRLPRNGSLKRYGGGEPIAPLRIETSGDAHFLVKLEDASTGQPVVRVFVKSAKSFELDVPLGTYRIKYASGEKWYGYDHLFGPDTNYNRADRLMHFGLSGTRVSGYTVKLYRVRDGNLPTTPISPDEF